MNNQFDKLVEKGLNAKRESKYVEFKEKFDPQCKENWCDLIKEIIALANTEGGVIMIGLGNQGIPSGYDISKFLKIDPAIITDKIHRYTNYNFTEFRIFECQKEKQTIAALVISPVDIQIIFVKPGTYPISKREQRRAFSSGTIYFRHGAKSEPGNMDDLRNAIERRIEKIRDSWLSGIRKVVYADPESKVAILPKEVIQTDSPLATPIRLTEDSNAPVYRLEKPDLVYPFRQKEVIEKVNKKLPGDIKINQYDILSVRRVYRINEDPKFSYEHKFGTPQYSNTFIDWLIEQYKKNNIFFKEARDKYYQMSH